MKNKIKPGEKKALLVGLLLIIVVALVTFLRSSGTEDNNDKINQQIKDELSQYQKLSPKDLESKIKAKESMTILDIRSIDDYDFEHITNSVNIPLENLSAAELTFNTNPLIIIVDSSVDDARYAQATKMLSDRGYKDLSILAGGIAAWTNNDGNTVSWGDPTSFLNQSKVTFISQDDVKKLIDENSPIYILDVRAKDSYSEYIPSSANIPLEKIEQKKSEIPLNITIIAYGTTELEAFQAGVRLYDLGILSAKIMNEGFSDWKNKGYPTASK